MLPHQTNMLPNVTVDTIFDNRVLLLCEGMRDSLARCVALACSPEYHLEGSYDNYEDPVVLAAVYDKTLLVYDKSSSTLYIYNREGVGCIIVVKNNGEYKLATVLDADQQHMTCFSKFHPLVVSLLEHI